MTRLAACGSTRSSVKRAGWFSIKYCRSVGGKGSIVGRSTVRTVGGCQIVMGIARIIEVQEIEVSF